MNKRKLREKIKEARQTGELDLSNNELTELPPEVGQLTNLTTLNLMNNHLTEFPRKWGNLP